MLAVKKIKARLLIFRRWFKIILTQKKIPALVFGFLFLFSVSTYAIAAARSDPYVPGATLDPTDCSPGETNCYVSLVYPITVGGVPFLNSAGNLTQDNSNFFWDDTNNRLGVGTASPSDSLHIASGSFLQTQGAGTLSVIGSITDAVSFSTSSAQYVSGKYAYVLNVNDTLIVVDISNPTGPAIVSSTHLGSADGINGAGQYLYINRFGNDGFSIVDISNPKSPTVVGTLTDATNLDGMNEVIPVGRYAYGIARYSHRFLTFDISNPAAPVIVGNVQDDTNLDRPHQMIVSGRYAYVSTFGDQVTVVDISDPTNPTIVGGIADGTQLDDLTDLVVSGRYVYVLARNADRLTVVDVKDPANPTIAGSLYDPTNIPDGRRLDIAGRYLYITNTEGPYLTVVDISDPTNPTVVTTSSNSNLVSARPINIYGKYAYVAGDGKFAVVDISGVSTPAASIGNILSDTIRVTDGVDIAGTLSVRSGINVGKSGIFSAGAISIKSGSTSASNAAFSVLNSAGTSLLRVLDSGLVGIGLSPSYKFDVLTDSASTYAAKFFNDGNNANRSGILVQAGLDDHTAAGPSTLIGFADGDGTSVGSITFGSSAVAYNTTSDRRLKENITNTSLSLSVLNEIQVRDFSFIADSAHKTVHGFIAQELYDVYPDAVTKPIDENTSYWMVDYSKLAPLIVKSIQELDVKISALDPNTNSSFAQKIVSFLGNAGNGIQLIFADKIKTRELCLDTVCITKEKLQQLLSEGTSSTPAWEGDLPGDPGTNTTTGVEANDDNEESTVVEESQNPEQEEQPAEDEQTVSEEQSEPQEDPVVEEEQVQETPVAEEA